jgi:hydroxymethylbilane synthase
MTQFLVIGSRGSKLAMFQSEQAKDRIRTLNPDLEVRIEIIKTTGDVKPDPLKVIGGKGVFTKELEDALLDGRIDLAVHSLKDLPTVLPDRLTIGAICEREDPRDALVLPQNRVGSGASLLTLAEGAVVGTSSQRRLAQLKALRSDVTISDVRGNVDTRLGKLDEGQYDALILASAGLRRLGLAERISANIPTDQMLPAVGQGAVAIEARNDNMFALESIAKLNHDATRIACMAERALLKSLGGGCQLPIAAHAVVNGDEVQLEGLVASLDGSRILRDSLKGSVSDAENLGLSLATRLLDLGANSLLHHTNQ